MPANGKLSAKPSPSPMVAPASRPKFTAVTFLGDCDDDDDFQPPRPRPLKPCIGAAALRFRKKLKAPSSGKENSSAAGGAVTVVGVASTAVKDAETLAAGSRVSGDVPKTKRRKTGESCGLSRYGSDSTKLSCKPKIELDRYGYGKGCCSFLPSAIDSTVLALGAVCDFGVRRCDEAQIAVSRHCTSVLEAGHATEELTPTGSGCDPPKTEKKPGSSEAVEGHHDSRLIEPRLVESDANLEFVTGILGSLTDKQDTKKANGVVFGCGVGFQNGNYHLDSLQPELLTSNSKYDSRVCVSNEIQEPGLGACNLISQERKVAAGHSACATPENVTAENKSSAPEACKGQCHSDSSASKLPESHMIHDFEVDGCDNFEIGTQLSELINLCMKDSIEGQSNFGAAPMEQNTLDSKRLSSDYEAKCPLCGSDISDLSEELRQLHTNNCLDEPAKESSPNHKKEPSVGQNVETGRVVEWLRNLGLSKYEEVFIREEVDWETLQWLTEEDLLGIGISSLGPRKKIIHALGELLKKHDDPSEMEAVLNSGNTKKTKLPMNGNKLITEYFQCSSFDQRQRRVCKANKPSNLNEKKISSAKVPTRRTAGKGKIKDTPLWCCIPGTPFRVDAFRYLRGDCSHWFLTHFHVDRSIIILFEPPNGKAVLHTGDFRFSSKMANNPVLQSSCVHTLILDTTYCNPRYDFPSQEIVIQFVIEAIQAEAFNPKTLFLIGSYTIGKERLFMEVARLLQKKVYVGAAKLQILKHLELPQEIMHCEPGRALHTANQTSYFREIHIFKEPTIYRVWTKVSHAIRLCFYRYEVPYSEHSSFTELQQFVKFISPEHIIPSVNNDGPESANAMLAQLLNE
ncbi:sterile alpha motif (SAM) domain-containing protein [Zea mays]|uniref:Sterile alpha motif (SAM) domain-containing protein n=1 Tax=Zea mays TaxID=4577 RepID=A0A1D6ER04_MAIZE|nr:sterile alpha motif (SAM) domain-containing protein [Zea mays]